MITPSKIKLLLEGIHNQEPVAGLTHDYYRYPARFSPDFTRAVIRAFTRPGDVVFDPFMGGGTTIVEASALGRRAIGTDINSLAVFVSQAKTLLIDDAGLLSLFDWIRHLVPKLNTHRHLTSKTEHGHWHNISTRRAWPIRKLLEIALDELNHLRDPMQEIIARCILLRTGQWALDCRKDIPSALEFRSQIAIDGADTIEGARAYRERFTKVTQLLGLKHTDLRPICIHRSAVGIEQDPAITKNNPIRLILTSPPYPGVHVLYHRWQVQGRKETPAAYVLSNSHDGAGSSFYTFGDRQQPGLAAYYERALEAFRSIARVSNRETMVAQMVAFSDATWQLPRYISMMEEAGFCEVKHKELSNSSDGRVWRSVPNRKWYASQRGEIDASKEVVLFHRLR